ncbi:M48 family metalloprotease [Streptomyces sp. NBC_00687]|uniref:M48 family metalloprotease n=1 Tax=Streptomyces sp. NBC_00687 TaxID=2975807 RepID=UPI002251318B|nr:M48 family metalloprotease [Streptomyces sp. NBC_00687]MCX4919330.1 M48 family metalloprotease [Streptomyces sp. NBC_00687]
MIALLVVPLVLPFALPLLARRVVDRVRPETALWTLTSASAALAVGVLACLGVLLLPLALSVPAVAGLAHLVHPLDAGPTALVMAVSVLAGGALAVLCVTAVRRALWEVRRLRAAHLDVAGVPEAGGVCVVDDTRPDAYALPGGRRGADRIVVTTGMLRALTPGERSILLAHERAHLAGRHHLFLATAQLAGWCHPALAAVTRQVSFAAERAADEAAARSAGDRTLTAHAVGHAALATTRARAALSSVTPGAVGGPVPARVKALLTHAPVRRLAPALLIVATVIGLAGGSALAGAVSVHRGVEIAQGEHPSD